MLGKVPRGLSVGRHRGVAGQGGGAGYRRVLAAAEGHCWVHEAEEGVSGVLLHLSHNDTAFH